MIGFIRYLKGEKPFKKSQITDWYDTALDEIRERKEELGITPASHNVKTRRRGKQ